MSKSKKISLAEAYPAVAAQWHPTKNGNLKPEGVGRQSNRRFWWKCVHYHEWEAICSNRTNRGQGCPYCSGKRVYDGNCLVLTNPELLEEWHPTKNSALTPYMVTRGSHLKIWWQCKFGHEWQAVCSSRAGKKRHGCPICSGLKVSHGTSLGFKYPELARQWHLERNKPLTPFDVKPGGRSKYWWKCDQGHEWKAALYNRTGKNVRGCPYCKNKKTCQSNSLAVLHPRLISEWHSTKNGSLTPYDVVPGSGRIIVWQCNKGHEWSTSCNRRTGKNNTDCPYCNLGWTISKLHLFVASIIPYIDKLEPAELYILLQQQKGLLEVQGKGRRFVAALKSGKLPQKELAKFAEGQPSAVDTYIIQLDQEEDELGVLSDLEPAKFDEHDELPIIQTKNTLEALESLSVVSADEETVTYFVQSAVAKIWRHVFYDGQQAWLQLEQYQGDGLYAQKVRALFHQEYQGACSITMPSEYRGKHQPNLMQRYVAYLVQTKKRIGNWSGTGSGKTLSAILASLIIKARITIVCCPNNVVDTWKKELTHAYPGSMIHEKIVPKNLSELAAVLSPQYVILNYDFFSAASKVSTLRPLLQSGLVDFIVLDEVHWAKKRDAQKESQRKQHIQALISMADAQNQNLHVLAMSATPIINNLLEGKVLIELVTGLEHDDIKTYNTVSNCIALYTKFVTHGLRYIPRYTQQCNKEVIPVNVSHLLQDIRNSKTYVQLEALLTQAKLPYILEQLQPRTIVYTYYREGIDIVLQNAITNAGWRVGFFNGDIKDGLEDFKVGRIDILIATSCISTGVDGLQTVCNRLIITCLPWTHAEYKQLIGRLHRQGQLSDRVDIIIPLTYAEANDKHWSWCEARWNRIQFKKTIADAAIDGVIPEGQLPSQSQAYKGSMAVLERLERGDVMDIKRPKISGTLLPNETGNAQRYISDLTILNQQINSELSEITHQRFSDNPDEWHDYHKTYCEARKEWQIIPYREAIAWVAKRPNWIIGDFGCGEAFLAAELDNLVYSFDHIAINDKVIACNMKQVQLSDEMLDAAVFSLSLMGTDCFDYLREAHRCLKLDGHLWIAEPTSRIKDTDLFRGLLERLGFDVRRIQVKGKFTFVEALKSERKINELALRNINYTSVFDFQNSNLNG
jgi:hypothetical protein